MNFHCRGWWCVLWLLPLPGLAAATQPEAPAYTFGVINQRSIALTAEYWNPVLSYVGRHSGVRLRLKMGRTAPETTAQSVNGEHDFVYSNHLFTPERQRLGFRAFARFDTPPVRGALVTTADSEVRALAGLADREVVFPSPEAFLGYHLPAQALRRQGVAVKAQFAGNQEGAMARLRSGAAAAAGVNLAVFEGYARREAFEYRVLWTSAPYPDIPIMAHPRVPPAVLAAVQRALVGMMDDPEGRRVLAHSAAAIGQKTVVGFVSVDDAEYHGMRAFYRGQSARASP